MLPIKVLNNVVASNRPAPVKSIGFSPALRLLVLAPHPDDFDAIAITLRYFQANGNEIHLAVLSGGSKGVLDSYADPPTWENKAQIREQEQRNSCGFFGLRSPQIDFLHLPEADDGELARKAANEERVQGQIDTVSPDVLFLPYGEDNNTGHQRAYNMTRAAVKNLGRPVLVLYNRDIKTFHFRTHLYSGFDETEAHWKGTLLRFHDSQQTRNIETRGHGFDDRILHFNRQLARDNRLDFPYAETFQAELLCTDQP